MQRLHPLGWHGQPGSSVSESEFRGWRLTVHPLASGQWAWEAISPDGFTRRGIACSEWHARSTATRCAATAKRLCSRERYLRSARQP